VSLVEEKYIEERLGYGLSADLPIEIFQDRFKRCRDLMKLKGVDALLIYSAYADILGREWARYFANYVHSLFAEETLLLIPLNDDPVFLLNAGWMIEVAKKESPIIKDVRPIAERGFTDEQRYQGTADILKSLLKEKGLENGKIGLGFSGMKGDFTPRKIYQVVEEGCSNAKLVDTSSLLFELIEVKTNFDIEMIRKAVEINCDATKACFEALGEGKKEYEGYLEFQKVAADRGADMPPLWLYVWSGPTVGMVLRPLWTTARKLRKGDMFFIDPGICYKGYYSDLRRSAVIGRPSTEQKKLYEVALRALVRMSEKLKVGVKASDIAQEWLDEVARSGYRVPTPLIGHGVGIAGNEPPYIVPGNDAVIKENMVISLESLLHLPDAGADIEDTYLVKSSGAERLSTDPQDLYIATA
jgi:Xaa-Pro aminopeptidase